LNELLLISGLVFITVLLAVVATYWIARRSRHTQKSITRRLALSKQRDRSQETVNALRAHRGLLNFDNALLRRCTDFCLQTGLRLDRNRLMLTAFALVMVLGSAIVLVFGHALIAFAASIVMALVSIALFLKTVRQKRIARFAELLPDSIDVLVRGLRAGYPLPAALDLVAREMPNPIGTEFGLTSDEIAFGQDIRTAIENMYRRVRQEDLLFLIMAVNVQNQTGGNLADILTRLSRLLRGRAKLHLKVRALTADGRMSAVVLSVIPFLLFGLICLISPSYFGEVRGHPLVMPALVYAAISLLLGNIVMYRMVKLKF
jgi:tight adherence protein B